VGRFWIYYKRRCITTQACIEEAEQKLVPDIPNVPEEWYLGQLINLRWNSTAELY